MTLPTKCPNCGDNQWSTSGNSHFLPRAIKHEHDEHYDINLKSGLYVRTFICKKCSNVVLIKETYDTDLK